LSRSEPTSKSGAFQFLEDNGILTLGARWVNVHSHYLSRQTQSPPECPEGMCHLPEAGRCDTLPIDARCHALSDCPRTVRTSRGRFFAAILRRNLCGDCLHLGSADSGRVLPQNAQVEGLGFDYKEPLIGLATPNSFLRTTKECDSCGGRAHRSPPTRLYNPTICARMTSNSPRGACT
jgi:hypothetical protein